MRQVQFQFTPLREGRHDGFITLYRNNSISIHAPPRGATNQHHAQQEHRGFQFTPLREGRRKHRPQHPDERDISIHAPPRGATMPSPSVTASTNFNSRPSARGDPHGTNLPNSFFISIHAPPRGATHFVSSYGSVLQFQFTPLREGRLRHCNRLCAAGDFNSRPSARGDRCSRRSFGLMGYFNSRPSARGDMEASVELFASRMNFNSRPSARGDPAAPVCPRPSRPHFNSRPSARGDWRCWEKEPTREEFQFTPLREGRRTGAGCCSCRWR